MVKELFPDTDLGTAGFVSFTADAPIVGFQLNSTERNTMLLFPHIAAE